MTLVYCNIICIVRVPLYCICCKNYCTLMKQILQWCRENCNSNELCYMRFGHQQHLITEIPAPRLVILSFSIIASLAATFLATDHLDV